MILWGWLACAGPAAPEPAPEVPSALDARAYRFCHVPGANAEDAKQWCPLLEGLPPERCPGLRETCESGVVARDPSPFKGCEPPGEGPADRLAGAPEPPPEEPKGCDEVDPESLQSLARWVAALAVAFAVLLLFRVLWNTFGRRRRPPVEAPAVVAEAPEDEALPDVPDAPSEDLLAAARRALAEGRFGDAVLLARGAALRRLGESGRLRLHRSRTDREYLRQLRGEGSLQQELGAVVSATEAHRFGGRPLDAERAGGAVRAAERLLAAVVAGWLLVALPARAQSYDRYSPSGDAALLEVLNRSGHDAGWRLRSLMDVDEQTDVLVLDLSAVLPSPEQFDHLRGWVEQGGVLLVAGDASGPFPELGVRESAPPGATLALAPWLDGSLLPTPSLPDGPMAAYDGGEFWVEVAVSDHVVGGLLVASDVGEGVVIGLADPRLLWNGALVDPANEAFLGDLLYLGQGMRGWPLPTPARVQLATTAAVAAPASGGAANNPLASMAGARLLLFVLQLLATWALLGAWRGWPFGRLIPDRTEGRIAFSEHVHSLGTRYYRLGATGHAWRAYAGLWLARLGPAGLQWAAERAGYGPDAAKALAREVEQAAASEPSGRADPRELERVEELWRVTRGRTP